MIRKVFGEEDRLLELEIGVLIDIKQACCKSAHESTISSASIIKCMLSAQARGPLDINTA